MKIFCVLWALAVLLANLFFVFVAWFAYGYVEKGGEGAVLTSLILVSVLFVIGGVGGVFFRQWGRTVLMTASFLTGLCLILRFLIRAEHFYFYHTHLGLMVLMSVLSLIFYSRKKVKALFA